MTDLSEETDFACGVGCLGCSFLFRKAGANVVFRPHIALNLQRVRGLVWSDPGYTFVGKVQDYAINRRQWEQTHEQ